MCKLNPTNNIDLIFGPQQQFQENISVHPAAENSASPKAGDIYIGTASDAIKNLSWQLPVFATLGLLTGLAKGGGSSGGNEKTLRKVNRSLFPALKRAERALENLVKVGSNKAVDNFFRALRRIESIAERFGQLKEVELKAGALFEKGLILLRGEEIVDNELDLAGHAHEAFYRAATMYRRIGNIKNEALSRFMAAKALYESSRFKMALDEAMDALNLFSEAGDAEGKAHSHFLLAEILSTKPLLADSAFFHYEAAINMFRTIETRHGNTLIDVMFGRGLSLSLAERHGDAARQFGEVADEAKKSENMVLTLSALVHQAYELEKDGQNDAAARVNKSLALLYNELILKNDRQTINTHLNTYSDNPEDPKLTLLELQRNFIERAKELLQKGRKGTTTIIKPESPDSSVAEKSPKNINQDHLLFIVREAGEGSFEAWKELAEAVGISDVIALRLQIHKQRGPHFEKLSTMVKKGIITRGALASLVLNAHNITLRGREGRKDERRGETFK